MGVASCGSVAGHAAAPEIDRGRANGSSSISINPESVLAKTLR
jgi:hypothetical protein